MRLASLLNFCTFLRFSAFHVSDAKKTAAVFFSWLGLHSTVCNLSPAKLATRIDGALTFFPTSDFYISQKRLIDASSRGMKQLLLINQEFDKWVKSILIEHFAVLGLLGVVQKETISFSFLLWLSRSRWIVIVKFTKDAKTVVMAKYEFHLRD